MAARHLPVLMYHHVSASPGLVTVTPQTFRAQMAWLAQAGWQTLDAAAIEAFYAGVALPRKSVVITFDDGYLDNWLHAQPVLAEYGLKAHLFLVTGWIGDGPVRQDGPCPSHAACKEKIAAGKQDEVMLRWSEVDAMARAGTMAFHSHTHTHTRWDRQLADPAQRRAALGGDLAQSAAVLRQRLGRVSSHLCWPQGYYRPDDIALAEQHGFRHLYTTERLPNRRHGDHSHIGRISTKERQDANWLKRRLTLLTTPVLADLYFGWQKT